MHVLIVDDLISFRMILHDVLKQNAIVTKVKEASNGEKAIQKIEASPPDLVILDIEMPGMNGIEVLKIIKKRWPEVGVLMFSAHSQESAAITIQALSIGAFDFIPKPEGDDSESSLFIIQRDINSKIEAYNKLLAKRSGRSYTREKKPAADQTAMQQESQQAATQSAETVSVSQEVSANLKGKGEHKGRAAILAIGISTGGPRALGEVLPALPANFRVPILIVQHMPANFTQALAKHLDSRCALSVKEAQDGDEPRAGCIYIAPGDRHMRLVREQGRNKLQITDEAPLNFCRPSVDYLFFSLAEAFGSRVAALIMTGMGSDGQAGLAKIKENGGYCMAQDPETAAATGMPAAALKSGAVKKVLKLSSIARELERIIE